MTALTTRTAFEQDKTGEFYVDNEDGQYGVFGTETGFCYFLSSDEGAAKDEAERLNERASKGSL